MKRCQNGFSRLAVIVMFSAILCGCHSRRPCPATWVIPGGTYAAGQYPAANLVESPYKCMTPPRYPWAEMAAAGLNPPAGTNGYRGPVNQLAAPSGFGATVPTLAPTPIAQSAPTQEPSTKNLLPVPWNYPTELAADPAPAEQVVWETGSQSGQDRAEPVAIPSEIAIPSGAAVQNFSQPRTQPQPRGQQVASEPVRFGGGSFLPAQSNQQASRQTLPAPPAQASTLPKVDEASATTAPTPGVPRLRPLKSLLRDPKFSLRGDPNEDARESITQALEAMQRERDSLDQ